MKAHIANSPSQHQHLAGIRSSDSKIQKSKHKEEENEEIKAYLTKLQEIVPFMPKHKKLSKLEVITYVIDYIRDLRKTLGLPLNNTRVPMIPSMLDEMELEDEELDISPINEITSSLSSNSSPSTSFINNNNPNISNLHQINNIRQPLTQISTPNTNNLNNCGSQEIPQLTDKSPSGDVDIRPVSC